MSPRVLLLNPPYMRGGGYNREGRCTQSSGFWGTPWPPYSLASIAAILRKQYALRILDCPAQNMDPKGLYEEIRAFNPALVISAISTETAKADLEILNYVKREFRIPIGIFGIHATIFAEEIIRDNQVDFVVLHEPEITVKAAVDALFITDGNLASVEGLALKTAYGTIIKTDLREFISDLDSLPTPAWDLLDLSPYRIPGTGRIFIIINSVRGCPFSCTFCNAHIYYGAKPRMRSAKSLADEVRETVAKLHIKDIFFWGDTFTLDRGQVIDLCRMLIKENLRVRWVANSRVDTVNEEMLKLMKEAGCWMISYGIESGSEAILKKCLKNISLDKIRSAIRLTQSAKIRTAGHFILGLPGETRETANETIGLAKALRLDYASFYSAVPIPGSVLYQEAIENRLIEEGGWDQYSQSEFALDLPTISRDELRRLRKKAYVRSYSNLKFLHSGFSFATFRHVPGLLRNLMGRRMKKG